MRSRGQVITRWVTVFAFGGMIYVASSLPGPDLPGWPVPHLDKLLHLGVYGVLAVLLFRALWADETRRTPTWVLVVGVVMVMVYGVHDEFHQSFVPGREFSVWDMAADGAGAALVAALWEPLTTRYPRLK